MTPTEYNNLIDRYMKEKQKELKKPVRKESATEAERSQRTN